ncbi:MAG: site-2 protease family protein [Patescibacteria group bacterium]|nr:site-2 protease family protein [Patescibacteria group bacterium]MBU1876976.1 site-2 protease family protein [Patescibacteria group bacterium]
MVITIFTLIILLLSVILHELAHGYTALSLGDSTAKDAGRLTLNPLNHLDFFGSFLLPLSLFIITSGQGPIFGWAKPVPINSYNFRDQKKGIIKVSLAGSFANFLIAIFFGLIIRFIPLNLSFIKLLSIIVFYNFFWGLFNLVPIPPLDGSHILFSLLPEKFSWLKNSFQRCGNILLLFFIFFGMNWLFSIAIKLYTLLVG